MPNCVWKCPVLLPQTSLSLTEMCIRDRPQQGESSEDAELRKRLDELEASMMQQENKRSNMDEQVALMEKSYQLAAKYMPGGNANAASPSSAETATEENKKTVTKGKKAKITPVRQVQRRVVSSLSLIHI